VSDIAEFKEKMMTIDNLEPSSEEQFLENLKKARIDMTEKGGDL
jgi:hypothetical protein